MTKSNNQIGTSIQKKPCIEKLRNKKENQCNDFSQGINYIPEGARIHRVLPRMHTSSMGLMGNPCGDMNYKNRKQTLLVKSRVILGLSFLRPHHWTTVLSTTCITPVTYGIYKFSFNSIPKGKILINFSVQSKDCSQLSTIWPYDRRYDNP